MKKVLQDIKTGQVLVETVPQPSCPPGHLLIRSRFSVISAGTERKLVEFGQANLLAKARARPDKVRMVLDKLQTDGMLPTLEAVFSRLEEPLPLGYCNAGEVIEVGEGVRGYSRGDRVISNGSHAEVVSVPQNLCARIPEGVSDQDAAFTVLGSVALQGVRLAEPTLGEHVVVIGLGLIGLLSVQILRAHGCQVLGADYIPERVKLAEEFGAVGVDLSTGEDLVKTALGFSTGKGIDKVLITASTKSSDPVHQAAQMSRKRGKIILVGVAGLELKREDFYEKELTFQVSCSYGPGRYDPSYERKGNDYPYGFVRWTEQRNFTAVLQLIKDQNLRVEPLISDTFAIEKASNAYQKLVEDSDALGILLTYSSGGTYSQSIDLPKSHKAGPVFRRENDAAIGMIGAGNFATRILLPAFQKAGANFHTIASEGGTSAAIAGKKFNFLQATSDYQEILQNPEINAVVIATPHHKHAQLVVEGLQAGKHVFVEKPLALNRKDLNRVKKAFSGHPELVLMVGYNRRYSSLAFTMRRLLQDRVEPVSLVYMVNAGSIPLDHWIQDPEIGGGRIIGEACHFIDLMRFLVGYPIRSVAAQKLAGSKALEGFEDTMTITLTYKDGSLGTIHYFSNGSKRFPKERLEVFSQERMLQLDNFRVLKGYSWPGFRHKRLWRQDKGHLQEIRAFLSTIQKGEGEILSWDLLEEVSLASFAAVRSSREKKGSLLPLDDAF